MHSDPDAVSKLQRDVRYLKFALTGVAGAGVVALMLGASAPSPNASFGQITANRINIVEPDGTLRTVLTSSASAPGPIIDGREGKRKISPAGLLLYNRAGNERGGLIASDGPTGSIGGALLDYDHSEAIGMYRKSDPKGDASAAIFINDPPPPGTSPQDAVSVDRGRIKLQNPDRNAEILLTDTNGKTRIRLHVDKDNTAHIDILDAARHIVFRAPQ
ncbi:MAG TPA: hypothetical protein VHW02_12800 [Rhizomicrobium sp.]|jgi:hypothetical protein|nr:hypothetical protein [Rhizomicrobium sp.]